MRESSSVILSKSGGSDISRSVAGSLLGSWLLVFAVSLAVYAATANRGPQWQDSGYFIREVTTGRWVNPLGLALSHPLHHGAAVCLSCLELVGISPTYAITLVSAIGGALTVACVFGCTAYITRNRKAALFAAVSIGVAHTFWKLSTIVEVYTLSTGLLAAECWCLAAFIREKRREFLWAMLLFNGLGLANHLQAILTGPVLAVAIVAVLFGRRGRIVDVLRVHPKTLKIDRLEAGPTPVLGWILIGIVFWLVGSLPYTGLVVQQMVSSGEWFNTLRSALIGESGRYGQSVFNFVLSPRILAVSVGFTLLSFPNLLLPAAAVGMARTRRLGIEKGIVWALLAELVIHAAFVCRYNVVDQHTFFLPTYVLLVIFGGIGAAWVLQRPPSIVRRWAEGVAVVMLVATPILYAVIPSVARHFQVLRGVERAKPYRDDYVYLFSPWGCADRSAAILCKAALDAAGPGGLILVEDPMIRPAVEYGAFQSGLSHVTVRGMPSGTPANTERRRKLLSEVGEAAADGRVVVLVPATIAEPPPEEVAWRRVGDLYVAVGPASAPSETPGKPPV